MGKLKRKRIASEIISPLIKVTKSGRLFGVFSEYLNCTILQKKSPMIAVNPKVYDVLVKVAFILKVLIDLSFLSKIQNRTSEKTGKKILLLYGKISR